MNVYSDEKIKLLLKEIGEGNLVAATISNPKIKELESPQKISIRPLLIKNILHYQLTIYNEQKVTHQNVLPKETPLIVINFLNNSFHQGVFQTTTLNYHLLINKNNLSIVQAPLKTTDRISSNPLNLTHNRKKNYILPVGVPVPFLIELGIMTKDGNIIAKKYDKFRQINRFLELVSDIIPHLPSNIDSKTGTLLPLQIIDFGCGKSALSFALYHYLHEIEKRPIAIKGLDLKRDVIENCQKLADKLGCENLNFSVGDINTHLFQGKIDLMISLHACDTATDAALEKAVLWNADVILCVPCCQHELYQQVQNQKLNALLRHGILKERLASLITDAARAELLTSQGYDVQIIEFIDMEHTPKNLLIKAIKSLPSEKESLAQQRYQQLKEAFKITPSLEKRLSQKL